MGHGCKLGGRETRPTLHTSPASGREEGEEVVGEVEKSGKVPWEVDVLVRRVQGGQFLEDRCCLGEGEGEV